MNTIVKVNTAGDAYQYIKNDHAQRCERVGWIALKFGVGNDMTTPFYTERHHKQYEWWPNGIDGELILVQWSEYS